MESPTRWLEKLLTGHSGQANGRNTSNCTQKENTQLTEWKISQCFYFSLVTWDGWPDHTTNRPYHSSSSIHPWIRFVLWFFRRSSPQFGASFIPTQITPLTAYFCWPFGLSVSLFVSDWLCPLVSAMDSLLFTLVLPPIQCTITNSVPLYINDWRLCCSVHMAWFIHETHNLMCRPDIIICGAQKEDSIQGRPSTTLSPALCPFTSSTLRLQCPWLKWLENQNTNNIFTTPPNGSIIFREIKLSVGCHFENSSIYLNYSHHECRSCTLFRTERLPFKTVVPNRTGR